MRPGARVPVCTPAPIPSSNRPPRPVARSTARTKPGLSGLACCAGERDAGIVSAHRFAGRHAPSGCHPGAPPATGRPSPPRRPRLHIPIPARRGERLTRGRGDLRGASRRDRRRVLWLQDPGVSTGSPTRRLHCVAVDIPERSGSRARLRSPWPVSARSGTDSGAVSCWRRRLGVRKGLFSTPALPSPGRPKARRASATASGTSGLSRIPPPPRPTVTLRFPVRQGATPEACSGSVRRADRRTAHEKVLPEEQSAVMGRALSSLRFGRASGLTSNRVAPRSSASSSSAPVRRAAAGRCGPRRRPCLRRPATGRRAVSDPGGPECPADARVI